MGRDKLEKEPKENGFSPKGPESPRPSWKAMPSFSSSSMIQLSSSDELEEAGGGRKGSLTTSGKGSLAVPSSQEPRVRPPQGPSLPVHCPGLDLLRSRSWA